MATVNVRRLEDEVVRQLKQRAAENSRSLEGEARHILEKAARDDMPRKLRDFRTLAKRLREQTTPSPQTPADVLIREDRDSGHRYR